MSRQHIWIAAGAAVVLILAIWFFFLRGSEPSVDESPGDGVTPAAAVEVPTPEESVAAELYFPDGGVRLHAEARNLAAKESIEDQIRTLVEALLAGPQEESYLSPLPSDVTLREVYLVNETTVFLDLASPEGAPPPASGSQRELLTVYSLVNTVLLNVEGPQKVVLLWNGQQLQTFSGHLDTARPLAANRRLIASSP